jgi:SARP family transcriptional regulator, regulator of embCAB operon
MPEVADGARVQLCGPFAVEVHGRSVGADRLGRQARVLFGYLTLCRSQPVPREALIDALWDEVPPPSANAALTVVVSRLRAVVGPGVIQGRGQLSVVLGRTGPGRRRAGAGCAAHRGVGRGLRQLAAGLVRGADRAVSRPPDAAAGRDEPWVDRWRRRLADAGIRALECYTTACLQLGGSELAAAERAARELVTTAPMRETGHLLLMRTLARGNEAEALAAYEQLRVLLRDELGTTPSARAQLPPRTAALTTVPDRNVRARFGQPGASIGGPRSTPHPTRTAEEPGMSRCAHMVIGVDDRGARP